MTKCCWSAHGKHHLMMWEHESACLGTRTIFLSIYRTISASKLFNRNRRFADRSPPAPPDHHHHHHRRCQGNNSSLFVIDPHPTTHTAALILTWAATSWRLRSHGWQDRSEHFRSNLIGVWTVENKLPTARAVARAAAHQRFCFSSVCLLERHARALVHAHSRGVREEGRKADLPADSGSFSV